MGEHAHASARLSALSEFGQYLRSCAQTHSYAQKQELSHLGESRSIGPG